MRMVLSLGLMRARCGATRFFHLQENWEVLPFVPGKALEVESPDKDFLVSTK